MAIEARCGDLFPQRLLGNSEFTAMQSVSGFGDGFAVPMGCGVVAPLSQISTPTEILLPTMTAASRKRTRDAVYPRVPSLEHGGLDNRFPSSFFSPGEELSLQFKLQQLETDRLFFHHAESVSAGIEACRRRCTRRVLAAVEENVMRKIKAKEEEIERIGKLNWALEQRVTTLSAENQIWRDMAQTSEAAANALRCNLQYFLNQVPAADDAESSSSSPESPPAAERLCRSCRKQESCVLLLPCRHLSLCTGCCSSLRACPVCNAVMTASVHVNLSDR